MEQVTLAQAVSQLPVAGVLFLVIVGLMNGWIVTGPRFREMRDDRDFWRSVAMRATGIAEKVAGRNRPGGE